MRAINPTPNRSGTQRKRLSVNSAIGGAPLAQGSVYLHMRRGVANWLTAIVATVVVVASICVILSPIDYALVEPFRLTGKVLVWRWVRLFSPFINTYAVVFLVGGAIVSAIRYRRTRETYQRFIGNVFIAVGGILPGIGGTFTRFGHTEVLYVTELLGLLCIYAGYRMNVSTKQSVGVRSDVSANRSAERVVQSGAA